MRIQFLPLFLLLGSLFAQTGQPLPSTPQATGKVTAAAPSAEEQTAIRELLKSREALDGSCKADDPQGEWLQKLAFEKIPVSKSHKILLVHAGPGCARAAQGANGSAWLIRFEEAGPKVLASPEHQFFGSLYCVEEDANKGLRDIVLGWRISATESYLTRYRFNGKIYLPVSGSSLLRSEGGEKIVPYAAFNPKHPWERAQ
jgi:hypothetical protein